METSGHPLRVLVVDDDEAIRDAVRQVLELAGMEVRSAGEGHAALDVLVGERFGPEVIVLDAAMPGMDGRTFTEALAQVGGSESIGVVCITALAEVPPALLARSDALVRKPFEVERLIEAVRGAQRH